MESIEKYDVINFKNLRDFVLEITFRDGKVRIIDFMEFDFIVPYENLKNIEYFNQVRVSEADTLEWPHREDFDPIHLYLWDEYKQYYRK